MANILADALKFGKELPGCLSHIQSSQHTSIYNQSGSSTRVSVTLFKAFRAWALAKKGATHIGVGRTADKATVAEIYHEDTKTRDICVIKKTGAVYACMSDENKVLTKFQIGRNDRGGTVLFLALMDQILSDTEAQNCYDKIEPCLCMDPETDPFIMYGADFEENLAKLCDNVYQRLIKGGTSADISISTIPNTGLLKQLTSTMMISPGMTITHSLGTLKAFGGKSSGNKDKNTSYTPETFKGAYTIDTSRVLSEEEEKLVPVLNKDWIIPFEAEKICKHIKNTTGLYEPSRTFYLEGLAGSGKTSIATIVAAGLNLPKVVYTCHAGTEMFDLIGQVMPIGNEKVDFFSLLKEHNLPSIEDIQFDLEGSYRKITGEDLPIGMDEAGCISLLIETVMSKSQKQGFSYVESDFIKAIKYGWVCEIQEPASVLQQGVLVGLNSLLEPNGIITLPTGEQIRRHPDTVIIFTANPSSYKGCDTLNQSIISRANMKLLIEASDEESMARKAMAVTGFKDFVIAKEMANIVNRISRYLKENEIEDGVCGQRELKDWMQAVIVEGDDNVFDAAIDTIIGKCTEDLDEKENIIDGFLKTSSFA